MVVRDTVSTRSSKLCNCIWPFTMQSSPMSTACQSDICRGSPIRVRRPIRQPNRRKTGLARAVPETVLMNPVMSRKKQSWARK